MSVKEQNKTVAEKEYEKLLKPHKNKTIEALKLIIPDGVPEDAKDLAAVMAVGKLASMLRVVGVKFDGEKIPSNVYGILMMGSGTGKDKAIKAIDRVLLDSYKAIRKKIEFEEVARAKEEARYEYGAEATEGDGNLYKKFMRPIPPFTGDTGTPEGVMRRMHNFSKYTLGGGYFIETEFASKLKSGGRIVESLRLLAEGFDGGYFESKTVSSDASAMPPIECMNCCLYLFTDPYSILTDNALKTKYREEMTQRYARRSFFVYVPEDVPAVDIQSYEKFLEEEEKTQEKEEKARLMFNEFNKIIGQGKYKQKVDIEQEVWKLFKLAVKAWEMKKSRLPERAQILRKSYQDVPWRGFKLAIGLAGISGSDVLTVSHFEQGLYYSEKLFRSIDRFEKDIALEDFERLGQYIENNTKNDSELTIKQSELVKMGLISSKTSNSVINDLVTMTASCLPRHTLEYDKTTGFIKAREFSNDGELGVSVLLWDANNKPRTKEERRNRSKTGYIYKKVPFNKLSRVLTADAAFVPFKLKDGVLLKENVIGGTKFIVFDIDESDETYMEVSDQLSDFTHHIATTSNRDNPYKFRVLIELDSILDLDRSLWTRTMVALANWLGIKQNIDRLHKTQTTYGYSGAKVVSVEAEPLKAATILEIASEVSREKKRREEEKPKKRVTAKTVIADYRNEIKPFLSLMLNGAGRNFSLYNAYKYFNDYTDDLDWIADKPITYLYTEFLNMGGEGIGIEKFDKFLEQVREGR